MIFVRCMNDVIKNVIHQDDRLSIQYSDSDIFLSSMKQARMVPEVKMQQKLAQGQSGNA